MAIAARPQPLWRTPTPLWAALTNEINPEDRQRLFRRPAILRFNTDDFMEEFLTVMGSDPERMWQWQAQSETWREPAITPDLVRIPPLPSNGQIPVIYHHDDEAFRNFKLYQPVHQRYYLVTASLVCRKHGLPDRPLNTAAQERVTFVMRRLRPNPDHNDVWDEYAFVTTPRGREWRRLEDPTTLALNEELIPMFGVPHADIGGYQRRVLAGLIPTGKREDYIGAPLNPEAAPQIWSDKAGVGEPEPIQTNQNGTDPRIALLRSQVLNPWRSLVNVRYSAHKQLYDLQQTVDEADDPTGAAETVEHDREASEDQIQMLSWYVLLDFAEFLKKYVGEDFWNAVKHNNSSWLDSNDEKYYAKLALFSKLKIANSSGKTLASALKDVEAIGTTLELMTGNYDRQASPDWPSEITGIEFLLADGVLDEFVVPPEKLTTDYITDLEELVYISDDQRISDLEQCVANVLPPEIPIRTPPLPLAAQLADQLAAELADLPDVEGAMNQPVWFIIRCVYERPYCQPWKRSTLSEPSVAFQIAGFFDSDAPARPIQIAFPLDISPGSLRKFDKNLALVLSNALCAQVERAKGLGFVDLVLYVLPWPFHKGLPDPETGPCRKGQAFGTICSLSIPIVTICALILLIIIVNLLNILFKWLPFFISCFPILTPGSAAENDG